MNDLHLHQYHQHLQSNNTYLGRHDDTLPGPGFFFYNDSMHYWSYPIQPGQEKPRSIVLHVVGRISAQGNFISLPGCVASLLGSSTASEKIRLKSLRCTALLGSARAGAFPQDWAPAMSKLKDLTKLLTKAENEPTRFLWFNEGGDQNDVHVKFGSPCFRACAYNEQKDGRLADLIPAQHKNNPRWIEAAPTLCIADFNVIDHTGAPIPENLLPFTLSGATVDIAFTLRGWKFGRDASWGFALDVKQIVVLRPEQVETTPPTPMYNPITPPRTTTTYHPPTPMTPSNAPGGSSITGTLIRPSNGHPLVHGPLPNYMGAYNSFSSGGPVRSIATGVHPNDHVYSGGAIGPSIESSVPPYINNANVMSATNVGNAFHTIPYPYFHTNKQTPDFYSATTTNSVNMSALNNAAFLSSSGVEPPPLTSSMCSNTADAVNPVLLRNRIQLRSPFQASAKLHDRAFQQEFNREPEFITDVSPPSPSTLAQVPTNDEVRSNVVMPNFDWEDEVIAESPIIRLQGNAAPDPRSTIDSRASSAMMTAVNTDGKNTTPRPVLPHGNSSGVPYPATSYPVPMNKNSDPALGPSHSGYPSGEYLISANTATTEGELVNNKGKKRAAPDTLGDNSVPTKTAKTDSSNQDVYVHFGLIAN
ncbi:hypothetical protein GG344DRAFT_74719 [Lentinula edodes]|nr:hypothetical protein GG344DRAFT_74719 [Lentinula edodes]